MSHVNYSYYTSGYVVPVGDRVRSPSMTSSTHTTHTDGLSTTSTNPLFQFAQNLYDDVLVDEPPLDIDMSPASAESLHVSGPSDRKRKFHSKSRKGCLSCKRRRVKCSENKPVCNECRKLDLDCSWAPRPASESKPQDELDRNISFLPSVECALMFHWIQSTGKYLYLPYIWTQQVPLLSFDNPHLLHAILSVTAVHQHSLGTRLQDQMNIPMDDYIVHHRQSSIKAFRLELQNGIKPNNADAMFATAMLLAFQSFKVDPVSWMKMFKGVKSIAYQVKGIQKGTVGQWAPLMDMSAKGMLPVPLDFILQPFAKGPYEMPIGHLAWLWNAQTLSSSDLFAFPILLHERFLDMVGKDDPVALVIMHYFFLLVERVGPEVWWISDFGKNERERIAYLLGAYDQYRDYLVVPT